MSAIHTPVGMTGLGLMGTALSARLIEAGMSVIGYDIDPAKCRAFGGEAVASPAQMAARCRTIIVAVFNAEQVEAAFDELRRAGVADVIVCTTTCAPDEITGIARRAGALGLRLVEAPISGTSAEIREGSAMALVAGGVDAIDAAGPVLDILCPRQTRIGKLGDAARTKLAINLILQNNRAALAEGIAFAESMGLDAAAFLGAARESAAYSRVMDTKGEKMLKRDFAAQSHIVQTLKDAELILEEARLRKQHLPMTLVQTALLRAAMTLTGPDADSAAVIEAIRPSPAVNGVLP
jgi:L-threonate 2-dehydrogenase